MLINGQMLFSSHTFHPSQIYFSFAKKFKSRIKSKEIGGKINEYGRILSYFLLLVIKDIIENNIIFMFPGYREAYLETEVVDGDEFIKARQYGGFSDIDYLVTNFKGYKIILRILTRNGHIKKPVFVSKDLKDRMTNLINSGKRYG